MNAVLLYIGSIAIFLWGVGHIVPTRKIVQGFGSLSEDHVRIITMEWISEGLALCFIGFLVFATTLSLGPRSQAIKIVGPASAAMLLLMAILSGFTGARTSIIPMRICPVVKTITALLFLIGAYY